MAIAHHVPASTVDAPSVPFPSDRRTPLTWSTAPIAGAGGHAPTVLQWDSAVPASPGRLRLFVACDVRDVRRVEAASARTGRPLGSFDIRYADCHQPYDLPLDSDAVRAVGDEGLRLTLTADPATEPLWIFSGPDAPVERRPALLLDAEDPSAPAAALHHHLTSIASVQPFGWMEGCVLDALYDLHTTFPGDTRAETALRDHLAVYVHGTRLRYEDPRSRPANDRVYGIEATLPFAVVAKRDPRHPTLRLAVESWDARTDPHGCVKDDPTTAEGCYTVAYPMAVLAQATGDARLREAAIRQLRVRRRRLTWDDDLYLRLLPDGSRIYRNWARAYAWYLLGLVRTLSELGDQPDTGDLWDEAARAARLALSRRNAAGIWDCYLAEPATAAETCGSAGIAAALALGVERGRFAADREGVVAQEAWEVLCDRLTPDGWLDGSSPSNKGGEELQRSGYRMLSGVGSGLLGQLGAALARIGAVKDWTR